jgi:hypothetical protein
MAAPTPTWKQEVKPETKPEGGEPPAEGGKE